MTNLCLNSIAPDQDKISQPAGLYIHIPFCIKKCPYCNFYSTTDLSLKNNFIQALFSEIEYIHGNSMPFDTIYFGGGTPSVLSPQEIFQILNKIDKHIKIQNSVEITMEVNPGAIDGADFQGYLNAGINRVNIGIQSFREKNLRFLGRIHTSRQAFVAVKDAKNAGFSNIGIDLIYGLAGQSLNDWEKELKRALSFHPEHLSCYMLTFERNTPIFKARELGHILTPDENLFGNFFSLTWNFLSTQGYIPYEISNFSRIDSKNIRLYRSRHNQKYWTFSPYIGLGPSAHSYIDPLRFWNVKSVEFYIQRIQSGKSPIIGKEALTLEQQMMESVFLGLRTSDGIDLLKFKKKFGTEFFSIFSNPVQSLRQKGYLVLSDTSCRLTPKGMRFHDSICDILISEMP